MKLKFLCGVLGLTLLTACNPSTSQPPASQSTNGDPAKTEPAKAEGAAQTATPPSTTPSPAPSNANEVALIKTSKGEMVVEFWPDVAPKTVENFKKLSREKFYDGTAFHRIIAGFMIQGGDPNTKGTGKEAQYGMGDPGYKIKAEFNDRKHVKGVLSMARSQDPDSAGSQFFICLAPTPFLDNQYTAFGKVIKGEDVLDKIGQTPTKNNPYSQEPRSWPLERVEVQSVEIVPAESIK